MAKQITQYQANDGKLFDIELEADLHSLRCEAYNKFSTMFDDFYNNHSQNVSPTYLDFMIYEADKIYTVYSELLKKNSELQNRIK